MQIRDSTAGINPVAVPPRNTIQLDALRAKVFLALPWQKSTNPVTAFSVANLLDRRRMSACLNFGDAFVAHSRNTCADLFLESDCDYMLSLDDDVVLPGNAKWFNAHTGFELPEKFGNLNVIDRLLSHNKTLIGGLYFGKHQWGKPMYAEGCSIPAEEDYARGAPYDIIKPTKWVATGCMLIHRKVFLDIERRFPRLARNDEGKRSNFFTSSEDPAIEALEYCRKLFNEAPLDGNSAMAAFHKIEAAIAETRTSYPLGMGEDVVFCTRATKAGHLSFVDMGLIIGHAGTQIYGPKNTRRRL